MVKSEETMKSWSLLGVKEGQLLTSGILETIWVVEIYDEIFYLIF